MSSLIVKTSSLGDIIHAFPVCSYLHSRQRQIDWVVEEPFAELVRAHPYVSSVYTIDTKAWRKGRKWGNFFSVRRALKSNSWDVVFDLQGNSKSALLTHWANSPCKVGYSERLVFEKPNLWATTHRYDPAPEANVREENLHLARSYFCDDTPFEEVGVRLHISDEQKEKIQALYRGLPAERKIMVCAGSAWPNKQLTQSALVDFLKQIPDSFFLFIWGNESEKLTAEQMQKEIPNSLVIERLPIPVLQNLMDCVDEVIAMDSLPLHLAATTKVATYAIFGASSAQKYQPAGARHRAFQGACPYGKTFSRRCPILRTCKTGACIRALTGDEIYAHYANKVLVSKT